MADWDVVSTAPDPWGVTAHGDPGQQALRSQPNGRMRTLTWQDHANAAADTIRHGIDAVAGAPGAFGHALADKYMDPKGPAPTAEEAQSMQEATPQTTGGVGGTSPAVATALSMAPGLVAGTTMAPGGLGGAAEAASAIPKPGFLNAEGRGIVRPIAGSSGKDALTLFNQQEANNIGAVSARVPEGTPLTLKAVQDAREPMHQVFNRFGESMPKDMTLPKDITDDLEGLDKAEPQLANIPGRPSINGPIDGQTLVNKWRQLKQEGSAQMAADGDNRVVQNQIGAAKLKLADRMLSYGSDQLPEGASVTKQQLLDTNKAYAQNYAIEDSMQGGDNVNAQRLGRASAAQPGVFTDGLKAIADHANNNPSVSGPGDRIYNTPNALTDVIGEGGHAPWNPVNALTGVSGLRPLARGLLTNFGQHPSDFVDALRAAQPSLAERPMEGLTPPPGNAGPSLTTQTSNALPQGPGPNPDLRMSPSPGTVSQTPQQPGLVPARLGPGPNPGLELTQQPERIFGQRSIFDQIDNPAAQVQPATLPKGKQFGGALFRGTPEGVDPQAANEAGVRFLTPNVTPEEGGTAASDYGDVNVHKVAFKNMIDEGGPADNARALGLPETANQMEIAAAAKKAGYDGMRTKVGKGYEYADLNPAPPAAPAPGIGDQIAGT